MSTGEYDKYLDYLIKLYRPRMDSLNNSLSKHFSGTEVPLITGGFFMGIWLTGIHDEVAFIKTAKGKGVDIASANVYPSEWKKNYEEKFGGPFFRLTFPSLKPGEIEKGIERIAETYRELK
jgi:DNA-binding transcriptional MocR family regulator